MPDIKIAPTVRPARAEEAAIGAELIHLSGPELLAYMISDNEERLKIILAQAFAKPGHLLSYEYAHFALVEGERMQIDARGALLDVPFEMTLSGGRMEDFLERRAWPIDLTARGAGVHLSLWGTALALTDEGGPQLQWKVSGKRLSDLAPWLGVPALWFQRKNQDDEEGMGSGLAEGLSRQNPVIRGCGVERDYGESAGHCKTCYE